MKETVRKIIGFIGIAFIAAIFIAAIVRNMAGG